MGQMNHVCGNNTATFTDEEGVTKIILHRTAVVSFNHSKIVLDTGGWNTTTTRSRMNQASNQYRLGYQVFQRDFGLFVHWRGEDIAFDRSITLERR